MRSAECGIDARTSIPYSEFRIPHWLCRRQHPEGEPDASPARQPAGDPRPPHQPREGVGPLVAGLRRTFDPGDALVVAVEGTE